MEERSTQEMITVGRRLVVSEQYDKAYRIFKALYDRREKEGDNEKALILSYYGLLQVRHLRQWAEGHNHCEQALQMQFYLPETYVNLARIYLDRRLPPLRRKAEKLLRNALKLDPGNREAQLEIAKLEGNKFQAISFLSPDNAVNRFFARLFGKG